MTAQQAYRQLSLRLREIYDEREAAHIADMVIEHISGEKKIDRALNRQTPISKEEEQLLSAYTEKLLQHQPVQYVLQEAWFAGLKFYVDENVLIPRPETEELVDWISSDSPFTLPCRQAGIHHSQLTTHHSPLTTHASHLTILDIGTGSGCIAIALKKQLPFGEVYGFDISEPALQIARQNAKSNNTQVNFFEADILCADNIKNMPGFDIIVSNPPYVKRSEAENMSTNVFLYEPHIALFVPDEDPLLFYNHIAGFTLSCLKQNGVLYLEINEMLANDVTRLLQSKGFTSVQLKKDLQGKDRMLKAALS